MVLSIERLFLVSLIFIPTNYKKGSKAMCNILNKSVRKTKSRNKGAGRFEIRYL